MRCQKIHICCVDKANIWWDDKKWFYQEMWKEIYLMCQQNICRDHKDICCVNTQQRMGNRHQLDVSLVRWRHDHCTKICKIPHLQCFSPQISKVCPIPAFYLLVLLIVRWKPESLFSGCSNTFFQALAIPIKYGKLSLGHNLVGTFESVAAGNTVLSCLSLQQQRHWQHWQQTNVSEFSFVVQEKRVSAILVQ